MVTVATDVTCGIKAVLSWKRDKLMTGVPMTHSELYWPNAGASGSQPKSCVLGCYRQRSRSAEGKFASPVYPCRASSQSSKLVSGLTLHACSFPITDVVSPAKCVRASVSLPVFFRPMTVPSSKDERVPFAGVCADDLLFTKWTETGFTSTIPDRVRLLREPWARSEVWCWHRLPLDNGH